MKRAEFTFHEALQRPAGEERASFIETACAGEQALLEEVRGLLRAHEKGGGLGGDEALLARARGLLQADGEAGEPGAKDAPIAAELIRLNREEAGEQLGHYKLLQPLGEGGFGTVWMAEQTEPVRRRVALKILKLGMDTKEVMARFEQERQALAMMDHPNIAKVFDAGATPTGRPYFVMELVRGIPITGYCDQHNLPTAERLGLFIAVCHAVQHAHQKGIIHRDLKPSNILVTLHDGVPVPKVIDFGVAKATQQRLTDLTLLTQREQMIGTPLYMSPEQAEMSGLDIDTRSDIYSLGVVLYELLTGRTPFDPEELMRKGYDEMRRAIREQEPQKPSTALSTMGVEVRTTIAQHRQADSAKLIGLLRGDLDWIVMKALEKDRTRRYETVNGLAMDLQRHLANEPVLARPPAAGYRFRRLVRRNRIAFAAGLAVVAALSVGITLSTILFIREKAARVQTNAVLERLRATAPTFHGQAKSLVESGDLEAALEKIGFAVELQPRDPAYRLFRAHTLQASQRLAEAAEEYRQVLELQPGESAARSNLALCEKLLTANGGSGPLRLEVQMALVDALIAQGRHVEAGPLSAFLRRDQETAEPVILARLKEYVLQPAWRKENVTRLPNGTFRISFGSLKIGDLTRLRGLPVSFVSFWNSDVRDLSGLGELPLTHLQCVDTKVTDLSPLRGLKLQYAKLSISAITDLRPLAGMPLETLQIDQTGVRDLSPLRGSPLRKLHLGYTKIEDLSPLKGMALEELAIDHTAHIVSIEVLRGMPLRKLNMLGAAVTDLSPLQDCAELEEIVLPENPADVSFLRSRATLRRVGMGKIALLPALDFWRRYDEENTGQPGGSEATLLREGRFTEMEERLRRRIESGMPDPRVDYMKLAVVALASGDRERYRSACRDMLDRFKDTTSTNTAEATAKVCLLGVDSGIAESQLASLLTVARRPEGEVSHLVPWTLLVRGLHEYRIGRWAEAIGTLSEVKGAAPAEAAAAPLLAMARHQQKDPEAVAQLERARELIHPRWPQAAGDPVWWHDWLVAHLLLQEAERVILGPAGSGKVP